MTTDSPQPASAVAVLRAARELLSVPEQWTRHVLAVDARGYRVSPSSPQASAWCLFGAFAREGQMGPVEMEATQYVYAVLRDRGFGGMGTFNDTSTTQHQDIIVVLDRAIARATEGGE